MTVDESNILDGMTHLEFGKLMMQLCNGCSEIFVQVFLIDVTSHSHILYLLVCTLYHPKNCTIFHML